MRTQQKIQVETIVAKYETLASNTEAVKEANARKKENCFDCLDVLDYNRQLVSHFYTLSAGGSINPDVESAYLLSSEYYIKGLLNEQEEEFLTDNFDLLVDYIFNKVDLTIYEGSLYNKPGEWSCLVPYILDNSPKKLFVAFSDDGREFKDLKKCDITVAYNFENAAIRAFACGHNIHAYKTPEDDSGIYANIQDKEYDAVIIDMHNDFVSADDTFVQNSLASFFRIIKDGGEILVCLSKELILSDSTKEFRSLVTKTKFLQDIIQLPSGNILLHIVKKEHDSFVACDASQLFKKSNESVIDVEAFLKEIKKADMLEREEHPIVRRYIYDEILENVLLPKYYLRIPNSGTPIRDLVSIEKEVVPSDECKAEEKVANLNCLSNIFTKGEFKVKNLPMVNRERFRLYSRVNGPAVIMAISEKNIAIGYTNDCESFLVPRNLYALKPKKGIDVKYLAAMLLSKPIKEQIALLVYESGRAKLANDWDNLVMVELLNSELQHQFIQDSMLKDYAEQQKFVKGQEKEFIHSMHLRKHALSQNISAFDSLFHSLEFCMRDNDGQIKEADRLSPVSSMTVGDAMSILHTELETICDRVSHLTDEKDWGPCESIEPQHFIESYENQNKSTRFKFSHLWKSYEKNCFARDIFDKETGKILFHKGESMKSVWFPKKALTQIFDNIVSNACEHGFTDNSRKDYAIRTSWYSDGLNIVVNISNNGEPLRSDIDSDLVLEYGYTTALNQRGHGGIGGGQVSEIIRKYGGSVRIISTPNEQYTVTYELKMPLASIY